MNTSEAVSPKTPPVWAAWIGPVLIGLSFLALVRWSWRKWPDVFIDYGMELYIPWQLSLGKVLYTDIAWKHGPLAQYFNALCFRVGGVSLTTLIVVNLILVAILTALVYRFFLRAGSPLMATTVALVFLVVFAFSQYMQMGSFNYVCPYLYEQVYGLFLSIVMLVALARYLRTPHPLWALIAGMSLGLVILTKAELLAAAVAAPVVGIGLAGMTPGLIPRRELLRLIGYFSAGILASFGGAVGFLALRMPVGQALAGALGNWMYLGGNNLLGDGFYKFVTGLDAPVAHTLRMLWLCFMFGSFLLVILGIQSATREIQNQRLLVCVGVGLGVMFVALVPNLVAWQEAGRILPVTTATIFLILLKVCWKHRAERTQLETWMPLTIWAAFSLVLLAKMIFHVRVYHYGFVLAMPATLLLVAVCVEWLPKLARERVGNGDVVQAAVIGLLVAGCLAHLDWSNEFYQHKTYTVGSHGDTMVTFPPEIEPMGLVLNTTAKYLESAAPPNATVAVMPHGVTLNYLLRRPTSTPFVSYYLFDLKTYGGEAATLERVKQHPPDFIVFLHTGVPDFDVTYFGATPQFGQILSTWIQENYGEVKQFGARPFVDQNPGVVILKRKIS